MHFYLVQGANETNKRILLHVLLSAVLSVIISLWIGQSQAASEVEVWVLTLVLSKTMSLCRRFTLLHVGQRLLLSPV